MKTIARKNWTDSSGVRHLNDIYLTADGQFALVDGKEAYAQVIEAVIKTVRGELQLDAEAGMPYFDTVFNDNRHASVWAAAVRDGVEGLEFVDEISSFEYAYDFQNGKFTYTLTVTTNDGEDVTVES